MIRGVVGFCFVRMFSIVFVRFLFVGVSFRSIIFDFYSGIGVRVFVFGSSCCLVFFR